MVISRSSIQKRLFFFVASKSYFHWYRVLIVVQVLAEVRSLPHSRIGYRKQQIQRHRRWYCCYHSLLLLFFFFFFILCSGKYYFLDVRLRSPSRGLDLRDLGFWKQGGRHYLLLHAILSLSFSQSIYSVSMLYLTDIQAVLSGASNIPYPTYVVSTSVQTWRPEIHRCSTYFKALFFLFKQTTKRKLFH